MSVQVTVRDDDVTQSMKQYAAEKGEKLRRFFNGITKLEIVLDSDGPNKRAEIVLSITGSDTIATHADHEHMKAAIDLVVDRAEKRVLKHKEKIRQHRPPAEQAADVVEGGEELESYDDIIDRREFRS